MGVERPADQHESGLVDVNRLLDVTDRLRQARERILSMRISTEAKGRWQRRLGIIATTAQSDLERASEQLDRFIAELDRTRRRR